MLLQAAAWMSGLSKPLSHTAPNELSSIWRDLAGPPFGATVLSQFHPLIFIIPREARNSLLTVCRFSPARSGCAARP
jgi:hypothetical protein